VEKILEKKKQKYHVQWTPMWVAEDRLSGIALQRCRKFKKLNPSYRDDTGTAYQLLIDETDYSQDVDKILGWKLGKGENIEYLVGWTTSWLAEGDLVGPMVDEFNKKNSNNGQRKRKRGSQDAGSKDSSDAETDGKAVSDSD